MAASASPAGAVCPPTSKAPSAPASFPTERSSFPPKQAAAPRRSPSNAPSRTPKSARRSNNSPTRTSATTSAPGTSGGPPNRPAQRRESARSPFRWKSSAAVVVGDVLGFDAQVVEHLEDGGVQRGDRSTGFQPVHCVAGIVAQMGLARPTGYTDVP